MLSLCMCKCISTLIPLVLRHDIAEILLKLALNTNQSTMGATTESTNTDYTSKLTDHVDRRVISISFCFLLLIRTSDCIQNWKYFKSQIKIFNYIFGIRIVCVFMPFYVQVFCFSSSCLSCVASFPEWSIFDCLFGIL